MNPIFLGKNKNTALLGVVNVLHRRRGVQVVLVVV